jgi:tetratricopeptide (TPR) repeat protein
MSDGAIGAENRDQGQSFYNSPDSSLSREAYNEGHSGCISMKCQVLSLLFCSLFLSSMAAAQARGGGGKPGGGATLPSGVLEPPDRISGTRPLFLSGKVAVEDGTPLTDPAMIQSNCHGRIHTEGYTDSKGHFSFEIGSKESNGASTDQAMDSAPSMMGSGPSASPMNSGSTTSQNGTTNGDFRDCQLQAVLPGFQSQVVELANHLGDFQMDVGTITLHRLNQVDGFTVSATTAAAPSNAKKEYEKGRDLAKKQKWDAALESYQKATAAYPKYAVAWYELGNVQLQRNDPNAAREAFHKSVDADPKFVSPYFALTQIAAHDKNWQEVQDISAEVLKLNPVSFPQYWMFNCAANYYLQHYDAAEQSGTRGLEVDTNHRFPQLEHLMGLVLAQKHDYNGAAEHLKNYLRLVPTAADAAAVQKQVSQYEQLSADARK